MRHVILTCKNHPELRWSTKEISCNSGGKPGDPAYYNGSRHIFFNGRTTGKMFSDNSGLECSIDTECSCPPSDLIIAPEDALVRRYE